MPEAMPVGLVGYEFTVCWQNRAKVLLLARARKRFAQWGYQSRDVQLLFEYADSDRDGSLNLVEFCELLQEMTLGLSSDSILAECWWAFAWDVWVCACLENA